jgi:uncharacterized protein
MRLTNQFTIDAPIDRTWEALLDVPRVARALPGATIEPIPVDGAYRGRIRMKAGAVTAEYTGTVRLEDADDDERVARFRASGRETRGQGSAAAVITSRLAAEGTRTRVTVVTELEVAGRQAQLGGRVMEEVAGAVLERFAERLERELRGEDVAPAGEDALDAGRLLVRPLAERAALVLAGVAAGLAAGRLIWRRR